LEPAVFVLHGPAHDWVAELAKTMGPLISEGLCRALGVEPPSAEDDAVVIALAGAEVALFADGADEGSVLLYAEVGALPAGDFEAACQLLEANHPDEALPGVSIGVVRDTLVVALSCWASFADADGPAIRETIEAFAALAAEWAEALAEPGSSPADQEPAAPVRPDRLA
jgi:hypothetical protein